MVYKVTVYYVIAHWVLENIARRLAMALQLSKAPITICVHPQIIYISSSVAIIHTYVPSSDVFLTFS